MENKTKTMRIFYLSMLLAFGAGGATYYIDYAGGSDANNGTSTNTPWKKCPGMVGFAGSYSHVAGDRFIFRGGVVWNSSCFPWVIRTTGTSVARDYYGVDYTWFAGAVHTRPAFDGGGGSYPRGGMIFYDYPGVYYTTWDGLEIRNQTGGSCWKSVDCAGFILTNLYVHGWHNASSTYDDVNAGGIMNYPNSNYPMPYWTGYVLPTPAFLKVTHCVVLNDAAITHNGHCVSGFGTVEYSILGNACQGCFAGCPIIHDCIISNIVGQGLLDPGTGEAGHCNLISMDSLASYPLEVLIYNNLFDVTGPSEMVYMYTRDNMKFWCYNNVFRNVNVGSTALFELESQWSPNQVGVDLHVFNNTAENYPAGLFARWLYGGGRATVFHLIELLNNHVIDGTMYGVDGQAETVTDLYNVQHDNQAAAEAAGYLKANYYAPSSAGLALEGAGTNLSLYAKPGANFTTSRGGTLTPMARPAVGRWDIGAYQYGAAPSNAPAVSYCSATPGAYGFGPVTTNTTATTVITVANSVYAGTNLVGAASVASPFSILSNATFNLAPGASVGVGVGFTPTSVGAASATASFTGGSNGTQTVSLTGTGSYVLTNVTTWYVDPAAAGDGSGASWANAWTSLGAIAWASIKPGDTIFLSGGSSSQKYTATGNSMLAIGATGTALGRVTIRVGQDSGHNGAVIFDGAGTYAPLINGKDAAGYVTLDGEYQGACRWFLTNVGQGEWTAAVDISSTTQATQATNTIVRYLDISGANFGINAAYLRGGEIAFCNIHDIRQEAGVTLAGGNYSLANVPITGYDQTVLHNCAIQCNYQPNVGGADGIQCGYGFTGYSNVVYDLVGTYNDPSTHNRQHPDLIQINGLYVKIYASQFRDPGDSMIDYDSIGGTDIGNLWFWNNTFRFTGSYGQVPIRIYNSVTHTVSLLHDILIDNNTFLDTALCPYGKCLEVVFPSNGSAASASNFHVRNNLFYNCGRSDAADRATVVWFNGVNTSQVDFDYNLLNAGLHGITTLTSLNPAQTLAQTHPRGGVPEFVSYSEGSAGNNVRLGPLDTAAHDMGVTIAYVATDADGVVRPAGIAYDIGAYESGSEQNTNPIAVLTPSALDFGTLMVGTTSNLTLGITNTGSGSLSGTIAASSPFSIVSGGTYSDLTNGQGQVVTVAYTPVATGIQSSLLTCSDNGGSPTAGVGGMAYPLLPLTQQPTQMLAEVGSISGGWIWLNGRGYTETQSTTPSGSAKLTAAFVATNAGDYTISIETIAPSEGANSLYVGVNAIPSEDNKEIWDVYPTGGTTNTVTVLWRGTGGNPDPGGDAISPKKWSLAANSTNVLYILSRELETYVGQITINQPEVTNEPPVKQLIIYRELRGEVKTQ